LRSANDTLRTRFIWLRTATSGRHFCRGFHKRREISFLSQNL